MARYLVEWELDVARVPEDPRERAKAWSAMLDMVEKDQKAGILKDWAAFCGELAGYSVAEGSVADVAGICQQYMPFVQFSVRPLTSLTEMRQMLQNAPK
jgi:hypothetical protein